MGRLGGGVRPILQYIPQSVAESGRNSIDSLKQMEWVGIRECERPQVPAQHHLDPGHPHVQQRQRVLRLHLPHQRGGDQLGPLHLHPSRHVQVQLSHRHHLVPLRRPELRDEVRELDVQRFQSKRQVERRGRYLKLNSRESQQNAVIFLPGPTKTLSCH